MQILTATFLLDPAVPEDYQIIEEMRVDLTFRWNGQQFTASSIQTQRRCLKLTAKAIH